MALELLVILALIQGITEFLPISSSGHLILFPAFAGVEDQGTAIDVAVHVGTLGAVMLYFWRDVQRMFAGGIHILTGRFGTEDARLTWLLAIATVPVIVAGLLLSIFGLTEKLRSMEVIGWTMLGFGIVLYVADRYGPRTREAESWTIRDAIILGLWQALALIPGTSRSGATMTGARFLGFERVDAARLALLMSIPTIAAAGILVTRDVYAAGDMALGFDALLAAGLAFVSALLALFAMMRMLRTVSMTPFVVYRVVLGAILLWMVYA
ncbi:MAG: undecaprenyl-diphosphate phosphatase [Pseudomonadota bacterium]